MNINITHKGYRKAHTACKAVEHNPLRVPAASRLAEKPTAGAKGGVDAIRKKVEEIMVRDSISLLKGQKRQAVLWQEKVSYLLIGIPLQVASWSSSRRWNIARITKQG
jgi:hypothetical protein